MGGAGLCNATMCEECLSCCFPLVVWVFLLGGTTFETFVYSLNCDVLYLFLYFFHV